MKRPFKEFIVGLFITNVYSMNVRVLYSKLLVISIVECQVID